MTARDVVAIVMGTRPEGVKLAPLVHELRRQGRFRPVVVSTGQHREMLRQALELFDLEPDTDLDVMCHDQTLYDVTCRTLERMRSVLTELRPSWVVVQGDTTTAFAASLAAFYEKIPVAHVEAGLRSGDPYRPFPEEINRRLVDQLATLLFAPTRTARDILLREGVSPDKVHVTGNTVVDALLFAADVVRKDPPRIEGLDVEKLRNRKLVLVTAHRRESFGAGMRSICEAILGIVERCPDAHVVYPVHRNPNVRGPVEELLANHERITLLPPVDYKEFVYLMHSATLILSDSGGVQEEAPSLRKPLLVMREVTERPEGIEAGVAKLVGTETARIVEAAVELLTNDIAYARMAKGANPYGDGHASARIAKILAGEVHEDWLSPPSSRCQLFL